MSPKPVTPEKIEIIARGLATRGSRVLLCRNRKHDYTYLPGGHVEPGETAAQALAREFAEETGLRVGVGGFLFALENLFEQRSKPRHEYTLVFHVEHPEGPWPETVTSREDKIAFEWADIAALPESGLLPPAILAWLVSGGPDTPGQSPWVSTTREG